MTERAFPPLRTFTCPQCGVPLNPDQPDCFFACTHCGSSLFLDLEALMPVATCQVMIPPAEAPLHVRRHLADLALEKNIELSDVDLIFLPFWEKQNDSCLIRASAAFPQPDLKNPSVSREIFLPETLPAGSEIMPIDTQPDPQAEPRLLYLPFYRVKVTRPEQHGLFLCSAVSGTVYGPSITQEPDPKVAGLFRSYAGIFLTALAVSVCINPPGVVLALNAFLFPAAYLVSRMLIESSARQ